MELVYVYVSKYLGIEKLGINFLPNVKINFDENSNNLKLIESEDLPDNFWPENIVSLTGIIGKNGTGKTTFIKLLLRSFILEEKPENVIIVYKTRSNSKKLSIYIAKSFKNVEYSDRIEKVEKIEKLNMDFIYHSNHFDAYKYPLDLTKDELMGMKNLSTNFLLLQDKETYLNRDKDSSLFTYSKTLTLHRAMELRRQTNFIRKYIDNKDITFFKIPRYLRISPNFEEESWLKSDEKFELKQKCDNLSILFQIGENVGFNPKDKLMFYFFRSSIFNLISHLKVSFGLEISINNFIDDIYKFILPLTAKDRFGINVYSQFYDYLIERYKIYTFIQQNKSDLLKLLEIISRADLSKIDSSVNIDLNANRITNFNNFFDDYFVGNRITSFANFELSNDPYLQSVPSSGELAMLNFFSRFHSILKKDLNNNIIILLDEVELALHPDWQKKFINAILSFFEKEFTGKRKIQLLLTSHSPFIISDIPKSCLNFLDGDLNYSQTFGANIHTLLSDSFFLNEGLIGEFAKEKIQDLIDFLNDKSSLIEKKEDALKIIELIGEPFIKQQLQNKYYIKYPDDFNKGLRIKELEEELQRLKND